MLRAEFEEVEQAVGREKGQAVLRLPVPRAFRHSVSPGPPLPGLACLPRGQPAGVVPDWEDRLSKLMTWVCMRGIGRMPTTWLLSSMRLEAMT